MKLKRIYKNWFIHNCFGHPLMYFAGILFSAELAKLIHDSTLPLKNINGDSEDIEQPNPTKLGILIDEVVKELRQ